MLPVELAKSLRWTVAELSLDLPRIILPPREEKPIIILTDGACEEDGTSIGGVLLSQCGKVQCFGTSVPKSVVDSWKQRADQTQVIGQAEILPVLVARWTWASEISGKRVIYFIDNESARLALVKAYSPVLPSLKLVMESLKWDQDFNSQAWYARVPTFSNIADGPSRFDYTAALEKLGAEVVQPKFDPSWAQGVDFKLGSLRTLH